jgi:hypothetical protein
MGAGGQIRLWPFSTFAAIAANSFVTFFTVATDSGTIGFEWNGDDGYHEAASAAITVECFDACPAVMRSPDSASKPRTACAAAVRATIDAK